MVAGMKDYHQESTEGYSHLGCRAAVGYKGNAIRKKHETVTGYDFQVDEPLPPRKAMPEKCLECCVGSHHEVARCEIFDCTLWPHRSGKRPSNPNKGKLMAAQELRRRAGIGQCTFAVPAQRPHSRNGFLGT